MIFLLKITNILDQKCKAISYVHESSIIFGELVNGSREPSTKCVSHYPKNINSDLTLTLSIGKLGNNSSFLRFAMFDSI